MLNQLNWRWPSFDILLADLGTPISWLEGRSDFLMHHLRDAQRRWFQRKAPATRNDLGDVAKHKYGIGMVSNSWLLRTRSLRHRLTKWQRGLLSVFLAGGDHTQQRLQRSSTPGDTSA
eukprot:2765367-Pyramimonas_sp.AAC.1